jgi:hypothetical protein
LMSDKWSVSSEQPCSSQYFLFPFAETWSRSEEDIELLFHAKCAFKDDLFCISEKKTWTGSLADQLPRRNLKQFNSKWVSIFFLKKMKRGYPPRPWVPASTSSKKLF